MNKDQITLTIAEWNVLLMLENQKLERMIDKWSWPSPIRPAGQAERIYGKDSGEQVQP